MSNLVMRAVTGTAIVAVIASCIWHRVSFLILCAGIAVAGLLEFYRLFGIIKSKVPVGIALLLCLTLFATCFYSTLPDADAAVLFFNVPLISFLFMTVLIPGQGNPFVSLALTVLGIIYIVVPFLLLFLSAFLPAGTFRPEVILGYFMLLWSNDTGAYVTGSLLGRHKLAPVISPKKTWEGSMGGALITAGCAAFNAVIFPDLNTKDWMLLALIVIVMGTLGDLVKSVMKRHLGVKDSGHILPGHGGILDRFDSLIGSIPFVYISLKVFQ